MRSCVAEGIPDSGSLLRATIAVNEHAVKALLGLGCFWNVCLIALFFVIMCLTFSRSSLLVSFTKWKYEMNLICFFF